MKLRCVKCEKLVDLELSDCGPHIKASCLECGAYIKFVSAKKLEGGNKMSEFELFFELEGSDYGDGVLLDKYGDRYSLVAAQKSQKANGTIYKKWAFPQGKDRKPLEKARPVGVNLGNRTQLIGILRAILSAVDKPAGPVKDDIPF